MQTNILKSSVIVGIGLIALGLGGTVWAQGCIAPNALYPNPVDPTADPVTQENETFMPPAPSVTEFDGNLTCDSTSGYFGGVIPGGVGTEITFSTVNEDGDTVQFTVTSTLNNGIAEWSVILLPDAPPEVIQLNAIDATISASNKGSKGCNTTYGADALSGQSAYEKSNGTFVASDLYVCADTTNDPLGVAPPPPPPVVSRCILPSGSTKTIHGAEFSCPDVPAGETRTIMVTKNTRKCIDGTDDQDGRFNCTHTPYIPVDGFGYTDANGVIDFNNVCTCVGNVGSDDVTPTCDPNPLPDPQNPVLDTLEACTVTDAFPPFEISIQNPTCFVWGGSRVCY